MLGFPRPYCEELLYSTIARYGVHSGIVSPKELLQEVYGDTKIIATSDLPGHLNKIAALYPEKLRIKPVNLLYENTLFPLYAPFVGDTKRKSLIAELTANSTSAVHLKSGATASRIRQSTYLRYCPGCIKEQMNKLGECYWLRVWQAAGVDNCPFHGKLIDSHIRRHDAHRHLFHAANEYTCPLVTQQNGSWQSKFIAESVNELLKLGSISTPECHQWGNWYRNLAIYRSLNRGSQVRHDLVRERVIEFWGSEWLAQHGLLPSDAESCWLRRIFRKHRKSFSHLEHLTVIHAFCGKGCNLSAIVQRAQGIEINAKLSRNQLISTDNAQLNAYRKGWLAAVEKVGTKAARLSGSGDIYAWLYRRDRDWLIKTNERCKKSDTKHKSRVDWKRRDRRIVRELITLRRRAETQLNTPRQSMNWYLNQVGQKANYEKHFDRLPLCRSFFERFCEQIDDYQIRRITRTVIRVLLSGEDLRRWQVLRWSGLSDERLTDPARRFLEEMVQV